MKYFKFTQIDAETGISWAINQPLSGPSWPNIPGLRIEDAINLSYDKIFYVAKVDDSAQANPENYFFELSFEEYSNTLKNHVQHIIERRLENLYHEEKEFRDFYFSKYHDTVFSMSSAKYEQAIEYTNNNNSLVAELRLEASIRGISVQLLAERIIENYKKFKEDDAKISGIRGKILDRLKNFVFNIQDPDSSISEFYSNEILSSIEIDDPLSNNYAKKQVDITSNKYELDIGIRFQYV